MKLKKELRAVKEINEQARREREEHTNDKHTSKSGDSDKNRSRERSERDRVLDNGEAKKEKFQLLIPLPRLLTTTAAVSWSKGTIQIFSLKMESWVGWWVLVGLVDSLV